MNRRLMVVHFTRSLMAMGLLGPSWAAPAQAPAASPKGAGAAPGARMAAKNAPIVIVGDSLSAEYGLARNQGWVALLTQRLQRQGLPRPVVNASISGDTTSGGRSRLGSLLKQHQPGLVVIELGGNDALRGLPLTMTRDNLTSMVQSAKASGAKVLLVGMQVPPNYGRGYGESFARLYTEIAAAEKVALVPFMLKGVADVANAETYFQSDRIHPNEQAHPIILETIWRAMEPLLRG